MFRKAMKTNDMRTQNNDVTHSTSGKFVLDFFFKLGAMRNESDADKLRVFTSAWAENPLDALRAVFYARDIRQGQGERQLFRVALEWLGENYPDVVAKNLHLVSEYGRVDDLFVLFGTELESDILDYLWDELEKDNGLVAKWMPRETSTNGKLARHIAQSWGLSMREYRKLIVSKTQVVENQMSANDWNINYSHVPSQAMMKYRKAFPKHDPDGWLSYLNSLEKGETKVNSATLYPSDIVGKILQGSRDRIFDHQWNSLPNWVNEGDFIPVCDVSGSMSGKPMEVSIGLGLYLSERAKPAFKNFIITFSTYPEFHEVVGNNIRERVNNLHRANWQMSTDLRKVFIAILDRAKSYGLSPEDMPKNLLVISDMQFNEGVSGNSTYDDITKMFQNSGYDRPNLIWWNVNAVNNATPVKFDESGTALVSGYSPSIMQHILSGDFNPYDIMRKVLDSERYNQIQI